MTLIIADNVRETSTTSGTGALTLAGAVAGFRRFRDVCSVGDEIDVRVSDGTAWEVGIYTYSGTDTLTRSHVRKSSNSNNAVSFSSNSKDVVLTLPADRLASVPNRNLLVNSSFRFQQRGTSLTLADGAMGPDGWFVLSESGSVALSFGNTTYESSSYAIGTVSSTQRIGFGQVLWHSDFSPFAINPHGWFQCNVTLSSAKIVRAAVLRTTGTTTLNNAPRDFVNNWASTTYTAGNFFHANWEPLAVVQSASALTHYISFPLTIVTSARNMGVFVWTEDQLTSGQSMDISAPILSDGRVPQYYSAPPWEAELAACQRRFYKTFEPGVAPVQNVGNGRGAPAIFAYGTGGGSLPLFFPVEMGKVPTITRFNPNAANSDWNPGSVAANNGTPTQRGVTLSISGTPIANTEYKIHVTAEAEPCS